MLRNTVIIAALAALGPVGSAAAEQAYEGPGSDLWIEARLITTYSLNEHLNPLDLGVDAEKGTVTLTGEVDNQAEKELAVRIAEGLEGVGKVEDRIEVGKDAGGAKAQNSLYRFVNDANITARIKMRLLWNEITGGLDIDVDTSDGVVTLAGPVHSEEERQMAERVARRTDGVREVNNELRVAPEETLAHEARRATLDAGRQLSDAWITASVSTSLGFDTTINHDRIEVATDSGVVTLTGEVPTLLQKKDAAEIARETSGVRGVENQLIVTHWK